MKRTVGGWNQVQFPIVRRQKCPCRLNAPNPTGQMPTNFGFGALIAGDRVVFLFSHGFGYGGNTGRLHRIACQYVNGRHADDPVPGVHEHQKEAA